MFNNINIPVLYKYRPATPVAQIERLVENGEIWFSRASTFNDPFDTALTYNFEGLNTELAEKWAAHAVARHLSHLDENARKQFAEDRISQIRNDPDYRKTLESEFIEQNYKKFGICCLSEVRGNILMWGHYAQSHAGLCIGIKVSHLWVSAQQLAKRNEMLDLVNMTYTDTKPQINFFKSMLDDDSEHVMTFVSTKLDQWSYEREVRLVFWNHPESSWLFGRDLVSEIVFGCRFPERDRDVLMANLRARNPSILFFQATTDDAHFKLNISEIK